MAIGRINPLAAYESVCGNRVGWFWPRASKDSRAVERKTKQRILIFLLRYMHRYGGKTQWSRVHFRWIALLKMPRPTHQVVLQESLDALSECTQRVSRLTEQIQSLLPHCQMFTVALALQTLRGVSFIVAIATLAELGDLTRFASPVELMSSLGLVPFRTFVYRSD
jgi:transposase